MNKIDILYNEYSEIKNNYLKSKSLNLKEELKDKLIELDYEINREYESKLESDFSMTTTLEKEEIRLSKFISFIQEKVDFQKKLVEDYRKVTGLSIELSYLKGSNKIKEYKQRLELVRRFLEIKKELIKLVDNKVEKSDIKIKVLKNRLMKKEMLNLLYEFCLIDSLDVQDIDIEKIIKEKEKMSDISSNVTLNNVLEDEKMKEKIEIIPMISQPVESLPETSNFEKLDSEKKEEDDNRILSSMPKIEKLGTVSPVNIFESIKKTEEKLPDVVIPSNGLTNDSNEIFLNTKEYFN